MIKYESIHGIKFGSPLACELDNQIYLHRFKKLYEFMDDFDRPALMEWCRIRYFSADLNQITDTLLNLFVLKKKIVDYNIK